MTWTEVGVWFADRCLPGLIDAIPFILVVGFGMQWHRRTTKAAMVESNKKQTAIFEQKTDEQTRQIVQQLGGGQQ